MMTRLDSKQIRMNMSDAELQQRLGLEEGMNVSEAFMILVRRVILLEDQLADYGLLVYEGEEDVHVQSEGS